MDDTQPQNPVQESQQPNVPITPTEPLKTQIPSKTPIIIMIIVTIISLAFSGYLAYQNYKLNQQISRLEEISPSPTASPTVEWKTYTTPKLSKLSFSTATFKYPSDWAFEEKDDGLGSLNLKLSKNGYEITLYQAPMGGQVCLFDDSPEFEGPGGDSSRISEFEEIEAKMGTLRYYSGPQNFNFCIKSNDYFSSPLSIGVLEIKTPSQIDSKIFQEAIDIIKLISINQ